jgi:3',5'-cyclic-AMP phosphodiesterase
MRLMHCLVLVLALLTDLGLAAHANPNAPGAEQIELRFAVLGDAEPKPDPLFPYLAGAVDDINRLMEATRLDFVLGVGDIPHRGTVAQYEGATSELQRLNLPFYPIMGNEEHDSTVERFLMYANLWNRGQVKITSSRYVLEFDNVALVLASPDFGRDFNDEGIEWILNQLERLQDKPVILVVHAPQAGVYPEAGNKGVNTPGRTDPRSSPCSRR